VTVIQHLQQVAAGIGGQRGDGSVVDHQRIDFGQTGQHLAVAPVDTGDGQSFSRIDPAS